MEVPSTSISGGGRYVYVEQKNIGANNLLVPVTKTLTATNADASITITFAATDYVKLVIYSGDNDVKLQNLAIALYRYAVAAAAYQNN